LVASQSDVEFTDDGIRMEVSTMGHRTFALGILFAGALAAPYQVAADCLDYRDYLHCVGQVATPGLACGVAAAGTLAFIADGGSGLAVIDVCDPEHPVIVGQVDTPGDATGVTVAGTLAYVADGSGGLQVIDFADVHNPVAVGCVDTPGAAHAIYPPVSFDYNIAR